MQMVVGELFARVQRVEADEVAILRGHVQFEKLQRDVADHGRVSRQRGIYRVQGCNHRGVRGPRAQSHGRFRSQRHDQQQVEHDHPRRGCELTDASIPVSEHIAHPSIRRRRSRTRRDEHYERRRQNEGHVGEQIETVEHGQCDQVSAPEPQQAARRGSSGRENDREEPDQREHGRGEWVQEVARIAAIAKHPVEAEKRREVHEHVAVRISRHRGTEQVRSAEGLAARAIDLRHPPRIAARERAPEIDRVLMQLPRDWNRETDCYCHSRSEQARAISILQRYHHDAQRETGKDGGVRRPEDRREPG